MTKFKLRDAQTAYPVTESDAQTAREIARTELVLGLVLPPDAVTRRNAVVATSGAGKTYAAMKLAEIMLGRGNQVVAIDVAGPWWGLRLDADGETPSGFNVAVFGGPHGDVPLVPESGALLADTLVDTRVSAVIDLSEFSDSEIARFCTAFAQRFFDRKKSSPSPVHLFIEEAHELMPQNPERDQNLMLNRWKRLTRQGRNHGIGWTLVTQSPQSLNKRCLNLAEFVLTLRLFGAHERKAVTDWVAQVAPDPKKAVASINARSPYLDDGDAFLWSPAWLKIMGGVPRKVLPKITFDSSKTPEPGDPVIDKLPPPKTLDLAALETAMKETVEKAKADDPKALRLEIARLHAELKREASRTAPAAAASEPKIVEVPVVPPDLLRDLDKSVNAFRYAQCEADKTLGAISGKIIDALAEIRAGVEKAAAARKNAGVVLSQVPVAPGWTGRPSGPPTPLSQFIDETPKVMLPPGAPKAGYVVHVDNARGVSGPQQRMLDALASFEVIGLNAITRGNLAVYSNQSPSSSGFEKNLSTLRSGGFIRYPSSGSVELTDQGRMKAHESVPPADLLALHASWIGKVSGPQAKMLGKLISHYPQALTREQLANDTDQSLTSSGFEKNLSTLRTLGLVDYPERGHVAATEMLFPAGMR